MRLAIPFALSIPLEQLFCFIGAVIGFAVLLTFHKSSSESMAAGRLALQQEESLCQLSSRFTAVASITREVAMTLQSVRVSTENTTSGVAPLDARFSFELDPTNRSIHQSIFTTLAVAFAADESIEYVSENYAIPSATGAELLWTQSACLQQLCFRGQDQVARIVLLPAPLQRGGVLRDDRLSLQSYFESSVHWDVVVPFNISGTGEAAELTRQGGVRERWTSRAYSYLGATGAVSVAMARLFCFSFIDNRPTVCQHAIAIGVNLLTASATLLNLTLPSDDSAATVIHVPSLRVIATTISPFSLVDENINLWRCDATPSTLLNSASQTLLQYCSRQHPTLLGGGNEGSGAALLQCTFESFVASQFGGNDAAFFFSADRLALDDGQVLVLLLIVPRGVLLGEYDTNMRFVIPFLVASFSVVLLFSVLFGVSLRGQVKSILVVMRVEREHLEGHSDTTQVTAARKLYHTQCSGNIVTELAALCEHSEELCQRLVAAMGLLPPSVVSLFRDDAFLCKGNDEENSTTAAYLNLGNTVVRSAVPIEEEGQLGSLQGTGSELAFELDESFDDVFLSAAVRAMIEADGAKTHTDDDDEGQQKPRTSINTNGPSSEGTPSAMHPSATTTSTDINSTDSPQLSSKGSSGAPERRLLNRLFLLDGSLVLRRVTCMSGNMENFLQVFLTPEETVRAHSLIVETIVEASTKRRGVFDSFHGDRFFVSFNAAVTCANQVARAVETFLTIETKLTHERRAGGHSSLPDTVSGCLPSASNPAVANSRSQRREKDRSFFVRWGFASGIAMCGYLGNACVKRLSVVGRCVNRSIQLMNACKIEMVQTLLAPEIFKSCDELFLFQHIAVLPLAPEVEEEGNPLADKPRDQGAIVNDGSTPSLPSPPQCSATTLQLACTIILFDSVPERIVDVSNAAFEVLFASGDESRARAIAKELPLGVAHRLIKAARILRDQRKKMILAATAECDRRKRVGGF